MLQLCSKCLNTVEACFGDGRVLTAVFVVLSIMSSAVTPRVLTAGLEPQIDKQWVSSHRHHTNTGDRPLSRLTTRT